MNLFSHLPSVNSARPVLLASLLISGVSAGTELPELGMPELQRLAREQSPRLAAARHARNSQALEANAARPGFRPEVMAGIDQTFRSPRLDLPGKSDAVVIPNSLTRISLNVRQPLLQFGAGDAPRRRAEAMLGQADEELRAEELDLMREVADAYLAAAEARAGLRVARDGVRVAREAVALVELLRERGLRSDLDVLEVKRSLSEAEVAEIRAATGERAALVNVNRLTGRDAEAELRLREPDGLPTPPAPLTELLRTARERRPELRQLRHALEAAGAGLQLAKASRQPRLDLEVGLSRQNETVLTPRNSVSAGFAITAPLFEGPGRRAAVGQATERVGQLRAHQQALEAGIRAEIEQYRLADADARARLAVSARSVETAQQVYEITRARFERERAIPADLESARLAVGRVRLTQTAAEFDIRRSEVGLRRAVGSFPGEP